MNGSMGGMHLLMRQEVKDEEDAAGTQTLDESASGQCGIVKVMEAEADSGDVEIEEVWRGEGGWGWVVWKGEVALVGVHLVFGETLVLSADIVCSYHVL